MKSDHLFFFFNDTATTEIYTLSLHDALPISLDKLDDQHLHVVAGGPQREPERGRRLALAVAGVDDHQSAGLLFLDSRHGDRKSTRLNSSHANISYAVFCLKKKKIYQNLTSML